MAHCSVSNMKLASGAAPLEGFRRHGVVVGLSTDGGISNNSVSMWECLKVGSLLQKVTHLDATAVDAAQAVRMATIDGARLPLGLAAFSLRLSGSPNAFSVCTTWRSTEQGLAEMHEARNDHAAGRIHGRLGRHAAQP